jgi:hypothetical protein
MFELSQSAFENNLRKHFCFDAGTIESLHYSAEKQNLFFRHWHPKPERTLISIYRARLEGVLSAGS